MILALHGPTLAQHHADNQIDDAGACLGRKLQKWAIEAGPKSSLLVSVHVCIWETFHQRFNFAPELFGIDSSCLKAWVVTERPGNRKRFGGEPAFFCRLGGGVPLGGQNREKVHRGKPGRLPALQILQDTLGAILQRLQDRRGVDEQLETVSVRAARNSFG